MLLNNLKIGWSMYRLQYSPQAKKDAKKLANSGLKEKAEALLDVIANDPFGYPPPFEHLRGNLEGFISRRINIQHRIVYRVLEEENIVMILRMWTHYE